jgi:hypothetical protein
MQRTPIVIVRIFPIYTIFSSRESLTASQKIGERKLKERVEKEVKTEGKGRL